MKNRIIFAAITVLSLSLSQAFAQEELELAGQWKKNGKGSVYHGLGAKTVYPTLAPNELPVFAGGTATPETVTAARVNYVCNCFTASGTVVVAQQNYASATNPVDRIAISESCEAFEGQYHIVGNSQRSEALSCGITISAVANPQVGLYSASLRGRTLTVDETGSWINVEGKGDMPIDEFRHQLALEEEKLEATERKFEQMGRGKNDY